MARRGTLIGRVDTRALILGLTVLCLGALAGLCVTLIMAHQQVGLAVVLPVVALSPIFVRVIQRKFDPFEPIQTLAVTLFILYGVRPGAELISNSTYFIGQYTRGGFTAACLVSLVGIVSLYVGYALHSGVSAARRAPRLPSAWDPERSVRFGIWVLVACAVLTAAFGATVGFSTLFHFYLGRTTTGFQTFLAVSGYVGLGPYLSIPAAIIFGFAFARLRTFKTLVLFIGSLAVAIFVSVPQGDRTYILAFVFPLIVFPYLRVNKRPSGLIALAAIIVAILGLNVELAIRDVGKRQPLASSVENAFLHIPHQLSKFATGVDLAEFTVLELELANYHTKSNPLTFHPGQTVLSLLAYPLPRSIIGKNNKPPAAGQFVVNRLFPTTSGQRASFNPAIFGDFYADGGYVTIVIYCLLLGIAVRFFWEYFLLNKYSEGMQIVLAATLPMLVILVRNSVVDAIARALFLVGPLLLCLIVCSRPPMRRLAGWRVKPTNIRELQAPASAVVQQAAPPPRP